MASATARAKAAVPASNGGVSNAPRGPFQTSVLMAGNRPIRAATVAGPTSSIMASGGMWPTGTVVVAAPGLSSRATTASVGRMMVQPFAVAWAMMARAVSSMSGFLEAASHVDALGCEEGVGHGAADHQQFDPAGEVAEEFDLA